MWIRVLVVIGLLSGCLGCDRSLEWGPDALGKGQTSPTERMLELGRGTYALYCAGCHGEKGDGNGPAARFLDPRPRDFRVGRIKFAQVESGSAPGDEDYLRTIAEGLHGTAMPAFRLLTTGERQALVAYLRSFVTERPAPGTPVAIPADPWFEEPAKGVRTGERIYHSLARCWSCHPAYSTASEVEAWSAAMKLPAPELRSNLHEGEVKESQWGAPIRAPDFLTDRVKTGTSLESLARVIGAGVGGTAMPTWVGSLTPEQLWGLAYYVQSLAALRGTAKGRALRSDIIARSTTPRTTR